MKHLVTQFKSLAVALKAFEPFVCNGEHLKTGKPFGKFGGMRSREILVNWLSHRRRRHHPRCQNRRDLADGACHGLLSTLVQALKSSLVTLGSFLTKATIVQIS